MLKQKMLQIMAAMLIAVLVLTACGPAATTEAPAAPAEAASEAQEPTSEEMVAAEVEPTSETTEPASEEVVTITMWNGFNAHEVGLLNEMIDKYWTPTHPNIRVIAEGEKDNQTMLTAMSGGDPPDVIIAASSETATLWASQGAIMDLTPAVEPVRAQLEAELVPAGLQWVIYDGKYYGLPFVNYDSGFFYNKDLFAAAGLDPEKPPETLDELAEYAAKLTKVDASGNIIQLGWMPLIDTWRATSFLLNSGGRFYDPETGAPTVNDPKNVAAFQWDLDYQSQYGLDKVTAFTTGFSEGDNPFQLGKIAMDIGGCWDPAFYKLNAPDLNYGVAAIPYSDPQYANATIVGTNPIVVPVGAKHPKEAMEFAVFFAMNKDISREYAAVISNIPQIKSEVGTFTDDPVTKFFAELSTSPNAVAWAPVPYSQRYNDELQTAIGKMYYEGVSAQEALDAAQKVMEKVAAEYLD
ncbi:MAG: ABC transporter substrate-binding protein [Anaerolineales bacterium]